MSFVVVIPDMDMDHSDHLATCVHACEPWRRHVANVPAKQHAYLMGLQVITPDDPLITPDDPLITPDDPLITPVYLMGLQHRRTGAGAGDKYWWPEKGSQLYFYQNEEGASHWPITEPVVNELIADFNPLYEPQYDGGGGGGGGGDEDDNGEGAYEDGYEEDNRYYEGGYDEETDAGAIDDDDLDLEEMFNIAIG
jgi:hypothetical protein